MTKQILFLIVLLVLSNSSLMAQQTVPMADAMRDNGKIYVVVAIILLVLAGFIAYLFFQDRKISKLEELLRDLKKRN